MPATPREVLERVIDRVTRQQWDALPELYAEDTIVDHPLQLPVPTTLRGRSALAEHFAAAAPLPLRVRAENLVVHETSDPEVVVGELDYRGVNTDTGTQFTIANIFVMRVRDGLIVESRDYANHAVFAAAFGRLREVTDALEAARP
jgi:ketosteroid isomerase-like protein